MKRRQSDRVVEIGEQRSDVAVAHKNFRVARHDVQINALKQVIAPITTPGAENGPHLVALEHVMQFPQPPLLRPRKIQIASQNRIEVKRLQPELFERIAPTPQKFWLDIAGRRN